MTCPDFQTTAEFLPVHQQQAQLTRELLDAAEAAGRQRQAKNHRTVLVNLDKIIASLQALHPKEADGMPDRVDRLREAARARHDATLRRATNALQRMARRGEAVTFRRLAETAGVSRSWLYRQPQLREEINRLRDASAGRPGTLPSAERATTDSLRQQLRTYRDEITRLRTENQELRDQLARHLGAARAAAVTRGPQQS